MDRCDEDVLLGRPQKRRPVATLRWGRRPFLNPQQRQVFLDLRGSRATEAAYAVKIEDYSVAFVGVIVKCYRCPKLGKCVETY